MAKELEATDLQVESKVEESQDSEELEVEEPNSQDLPDPSEPDPPIMVPEPSDIMVKTPESKEPDPDTLINELIIIPRYDFRCRVCQWSQDNVTLYNWICGLAVKGIPPGRIHRLLASYIPENYPDIKPPSKRSIWNHFSRHLSAKDATRTALARKSDVVIDENEPLISDEVQKQMRSGHFDEYKEMCALYTKFREVHDKIYKLSGSLTITRDGTSDWSQNKIATFVSMVNTQKAILAELGKMRQGDKLVSLAAKFTIELFVRSIVSRLTEEFAALASIMKRHNTPGDVLIAFENITHERLANLLMDEAKTAMEQTRKEFKLPS